MSSPKAAHQKRSSTIAANCVEIENEATTYQNSLATALATASLPVLDLPVSLNKILGEGRNDDAKKLGAVVKLIAKDVDELLAEKQLIDDDMKKIIDNRPVKKKHLSDHYTDVMLVGSRYLALNERAMQTVLKNVDTYAELVCPTPAEEQPNAESEAVS